jgi:hypothetical protein
MTRPAFQVAQAEELARAFAAAGVDYLFIGKGAAILLGYPGTTQNVCVFPKRSTENGQRIVAALRKLGFPVEESLAAEVRAGRDFIQIKTGPFDVDIVFAPDGIASFEAAKERAITMGIFPVANLRDIIASKKASGRQRDIMELPLLESFCQEFEKRHARPLRSGLDAAKERKPEP